MPTSSLIMPGILLRSRSSSGIRTNGMYQIPPFSFLHTSNLSDWSLSRKESDGSAFIEELGKLILCQAVHGNQILSIMPPFKTSQVGVGKVPYWSPVMVYLSQELTNSSRTCPSINKVVLHIKIALDEMLTIGNIVVTTLQGFLLPQMALLRSWTRTSMLPWSRLLP